MFGPRPPSGKARRSGRGRRLGGRHGRSGGNGDGIEVDRDQVNDGLDRNTPGVLERRVGKHPE